MKLELARIVLTGAYGGIGQAIAARLAASGTALLLVGRDLDRLQSLASRLRAQGGEVLTIAADLTTATSRAAVVTAAEDFRANVLINNAGLSRFGFLEQQDEAVLEAQLATNLLAPVLLTRALLPLLRRQPEAQIVNIGSTFGSLGYAGFASYCASKFGLRGFTEALRRELADTGLTVSYLAPRATRTELNTAAVVAMNAELGNIMDDPKVVGQAVAQMIAHRQNERFIGQPEGLFARVNALLPRLVDRALKSKLATIRRHAGLSS